MADQPFSTLSTAGALTGTEIVPVVQSGDSKRTTTQDIADLASGGGGGVSAFKIGATRSQASWGRPTDLHAFGDSVTFGTSGQYTTQLANRSALTLQNNGVSGDQVGDQSAAAHALSIATQWQSTVLVGLNDARQYGSTTAKLNAFKACFAELIAWLAIPSSGKLTARNAAITYVGSWSNDSANGDIAKKSSTANNTATFDANGTTIYIASRLVNSNSNSSFEVRVDGVLVDTFSCDPGATITTQNGLTYMSQLIRIGDLDPEDHSVEIKVVGGGGTVYIEWVSALREEVGLETWPHVVAGTLYKLNSTGYAVSPANATDAVLNLYNAAIHEQMQLLGGDGLNVASADVSRGWDITTMLQSDGIHPNSTGYNHIADSFFGAVNLTKYSAEANITFNSTWAAYTTGFEVRVRVVDGIAHLHGVAKKNGSVSTTIGTIPAGFRPATQDRYVAAAVDAGTVSPGVKSLKIAANGDLVIDAVPADNVCFDGISYPLSKSINA